MPPKAGYLSTGTLPTASGKPAASPKASPRRVPKAGPKASPKATPKAAGVKEKRRDSAIVSAEIWKCLQSHGVSPLSQTSIDIEGVLAGGRFKQVQKGTLKIETGGEIQTRDVVVLWYAREASEVREIEILSLLSDYPSSGKYVPEIFGACNERKSTMIVEERAIWGTLKTLLTEEATKDQVQIGHKIRAAARLARAMDFLQSVHIIHADLSCRNVLVHDFDSDPRSIVVKITDFGLAVVLEEGVEFEIRKQPRATRWCAPEAVSSDMLSHASDVWAYGATLWEMYADGTAPWVLRQKRASVDARLRDLAETDGSAEGGLDVSEDFPIQRDCPRSAHDAMLSCFVTDRATRPTFAQITERMDQVFRDEIGPEGDSDVAEAEPTSPGGTSMCTTVDGDKKNAPHFTDLREFLWSPYAVETLGEEAVVAMQREFENAISQQTSFQSLLAEQAQEASPSTPGPEDVPKAPDEWTRARTRRHSKEYEVDNGMLVEPVATHVPTTIVPTWMLWSISESNQLRQEKFTNEMEARSSYHAIKNGPCVLRDPMSRDILSRSWVQMTPKHLGTVLKSF